jgi:molybdenum cofactor cytidylyltransferase
VSLSLGVVILAAGASTRMGRPKLLLPWEKTSILGHLLEHWRSLNARQIAPVCAAGDTAMQSELDRLAVPKQDRIFNPNPERGMFSSIQCAAAWPGWQPELTHFAITLGDQPQVRRETLCALVDFAANHAEAICRPSFAGRTKHPVVMPRVTFLSLRDAMEQTLKQFLLLSPLEKAFVEVDDAGLNTDLDRPEDYAAALAQVHAQAKASPEKTA